MAVFRCCCPCHDAGDWGVTTTDVVEAAVACDTCRNDHVAVFKPSFPPPSDWTPEKDTQADGENGG